MRFLKAFFVWAAILAISGCASFENVQSYPVQPVKIIVPYPAGNAADLVGRIVAEKLSQLWGQPVNVENRPGAVSVPGVEAVAKSTPDGYTLLAHSISYAVDAGLYTNLPYDPDKAFIPITPIAKQPFVLVSSPSQGVKSVADLVAIAKSSPGQFKFASLGTTTQIFFVAEQFKKQTGINVTNVNFKGLVDGNDAVAKGHVAFWFPPVAGAMAGIREGRLVPLAVTAEKRSAMLPLVPTMAEAGVGGMENAAWFGIWAPAGVASGVVNTIAKSVERALGSPDVQERLARMGAEPMNMTPSQFAGFVRGEIAASRRFVSELGIEPQQYAAPAKP